MAIVEELALQLPYNVKFSWIFYNLKGLNLFLTISKLEICRHDSKKSLMSLMPGGDYLTCLLRLTGYCCRLLLVGPCGIIFIILIHLHVCWLYGVNVYLLALSS